MSMTDPIADLLTRIRNACMAGHRTVDVPTSLMKDRVLKVLEKKGTLMAFKWLKMLSIRQPEFILNTLNINRLCST